MKYILFLFLIFYLSNYCFSQEHHNKINKSDYLINGSVMDTTEQVKLPNASIVVIGAKDSILQAFTTTDSEGNFELFLPQGGDLTLIVHYGAFADYTENFSLNSNNRNISFSPIQMTLQTNLIEEVVVNGIVSSIKIKGDTTQF